MNAADTLKQLKRDARYVLSFHHNEALAQAKTAEQILAALKDVRPSLQDKSPVAKRIDAALANPSGHR